MCCLLLVCAVLRTLHSVQHILNEEECRSVGEGGLWWGDELAVVMAVKPPGAVQETLDVLEESKEDALCVNTAKRVKSKLCSTRVSLFRHTSHTFSLHSLTVCGQNETEVGVSFGKRVNGLNSIIVG